MSDQDVAAGKADAETVKRAVAKHELLDNAGTVVEGEEEAFGIRYTLLANSQTFEYKFGANVNADRMLAIFGAKTLATNETSQSRNNPKGAGSADEQIEAVRERFALIQSDPPKWIDRTREGVGAAIDKVALSKAIVQVSTAAGETVDEAAVLARLDDKAFMKIARNVPAIATAYAQIVGKTVKTTDDMLAALRAV